MILIIDQILSVHCVFFSLLGDDLEDRLRISSDEEEMDQGHDSDMYILNQRSNNGGIGPEHLVKPSQLKQNSQQT